MIKQKRIRKPYKPTLVPVAIHANPEQEAARRRIAEKMQMLNWRIRLSA